MVTSVNNIVNAELEGRVRTYMFRKNPSQVTVSGFWFDLSLSPGNPIPKYWFDATPTVGKQIRLSTDGGLFHGANVSPLRKYLRQITLMLTSQTGFPASFKLLDYLLYYPSVDDSVVGPQELTNNFNVLSTFTTPTPPAYQSNELTLTTNNLMPYTQCQVSSTGTLPKGLLPNTDYWSINKQGDTKCRLASSRENALANIPVVIEDSGNGIHSLLTILPRYTNGDGVQILPVSVASRIGGASFNVTYTNQDGVPGRVSRTVMQNANNTLGVIVTSHPAGASGSSIYSEFIPLQEGDTGVRSIESVNMITGDVGLVSFILVKPLAETELREVTAPYEKDFLISSGKLPEIKDDAFLNLIVLPVGSLSATGIIGSLKVIWG